MDRNMMQRCFTPGNIAPTRGPPNPQRMLFLLGDSHAIALVPAFDAALRNQMGVAYATGGDCVRFVPSALAPDEAQWEAGNHSVDTTLHPAVYHNHAASRPSFRPEWARYMRQTYVSSSCSTWNSMLNSVLSAQLRPGDILAVTVAELRFPYQEWIDAHAAYLRQLARLCATYSATLLIVADVPMLRAQGNLCLTPASLPTCDTPLHDAVAVDWDLHEAMEEAYAALERSEPNVVFANSTWMYGLLCDVHGSDPRNNGAAVCSAAVPGTTAPMYIDTHHLNTQGSLYLAPFIECFLRERGLL